MKLIDFINVHDNVITPFVCDLILREYRNSDDWEFDEKYGTNIIHLSESYVVDKNVVVRDEIDILVSCSIERIIANSFKKYVYEQSKLFFKNDTGYELIFANSNLKFIDFLKGNIICFIFLSDNCDSVISFFNNEIKFKIPKGSAITFPSNKLYPYEILLESEETNYFIVTWLK
jgi:hypothetical protein